MLEKILIADDEPEIADLIELYLKNEDYSVYKCYTGRETLNCIDQTEFDLAILDIMLPDASGLAICQKIREKYTYPIILLTAKDAETDKITGLTFGADDYMTKPFRPLELVARVKAQLRRYKKYGGGSAGGGGVGGSGAGGDGGASVSSGTGRSGNGSAGGGVGSGVGSGSGASVGSGIGRSGSGSGGSGAGGDAGAGNDDCDAGVFVHAGLEINVNTHEATLNEKPLSLTPTEFSILRILCANKGNVVSSEKLFHEIWGEEYFSKSNNTITVHIRHLREKLGDTMDNPKYVKTVWGVGYKIGR